MAPKTEREQGDRTTAGAARRNLKTSLVKDMTDKSNADGTYWYGSAIDGTLKEDSKNAKEVINSSANKKVARQKRIDDKRKKKMDAERKKRGNPTPVQKIGYSPSGRDNNVSNGLAAAMNR